MRVIFLCHIKQAEYETLLLFKVGEMLKQFAITKAKRTIKDAFLFAYPKVKLKINQGTVKGCREKLPNGRSYYRFSGIPYAKSPIGQLRFKSPEKLLKFESTVLDCTREQDACFQKSTVTKKFVGSEDCLNLNVYAPADVARKLPVMVFIHGGGFGFDSNSVDFYSPEYLLMEDVIVVTINYRLHVLGFVSLPSMGISGNAGLKDQQMALEWVYENISYFNGDPDNICLFGESAGGSSVYLHTLNPKSRKFIKSAICQSGTIIDPWLFQRDGVTKTRKLAATLGAKGESDKDIYEALMVAKPELFWKHMLKHQEPDELRRTLPFVFKPIVEEESADAFITKIPLELIKSQAGQIKFPLMFGLTSGDGMTMSSFYRRNLEVYNEDKVKMIPFTVKIDPMSNEAKNLGEEISQFYFGNKGPCLEQMQKFITLMSDFYFVMPQIIHAKLNQIHHPSVNQFLYEFDFDGRLNFYKKALKMEEYKGSCHFDDLSYLFRHQVIDVPVSENSREHKMRARMCKLWTNFAKYGNPAPKEHNPLKVSWDPVRASDENLKHMILSENPHMVENIHSDRVQFWTKIFEKFNGSILSPNF